MQDIEAIATGKEDFRRVLYTAWTCQLVVMALKPQDEIGTEVHKLKQILRVALWPRKSLIVSAGARHTLINTGIEPPKLYTL